MARIDILAALAVSDTTAPWSRKWRRPGPRQFGACQAYDPHEGLAQLIQLDQDAGLMRWEAR